MGEHVFRGGHQAGRSYLSDLARGWAYEMNKANRPDLENILEHFPEVEKWSPASNGDGYGNGRALARGYLRGLRDLERRWK